MFDKPDSAALERAIDDHELDMDEMYNELFHARKRGVSCPTAERVYKLLTGEEIQNG